jgi:hypothetical protein
VKKFFFIFIFSFFSSFAQASSNITHEFIARAVIDILPDKNLQNLIRNNLDAYLTGTNYPDSGFVYGTHYGEDSHWDTFIYTFSDYIKEKYTYPELENPKLVAFLFGCAVHRLSDEVVHWTFYPIMSSHDFSGNWLTDGTHNYGYVGIDLLLIIDKNQWSTGPSTWWVPVNDLVLVYRKMGKNDYTAKEITWGNSVLFLVDYVEPIIAAPLYPYLKFRMPWTAAHYYDWPEGGIKTNEIKTSEYLMDLWGKLHDKKIKESSHVTNKKYSIHHNEQNVLSLFTSQLLAKGLINYSSATYEDGSIEISSPFVTKHTEFGRLTTEFIENIFKK